MYDNKKRNTFWYYGTRFLSPVVDLNDKALRGVLVIVGYRFTVKYSAQRVQINKCIFLLLF